MRVNKYFYIFNILSINTGLSMPKEVFEATEFFTENIFVHVYNIYCIHLLKKKFLHNKSLNIKGVKHKVISIQSGQDRSSLNNLVINVHDNP